jgi:hypothetical protein
MNEVKRKARAKLKEGRLRRFPEARLDALYPDSGVVLKLCAGEEMLQVSSRGQWGKGDIESWTTMKIDLRDNPVRLGQFIVALAARYNVMVEDMNERAVTCKIKAVQRIPK